MTIYPALIHYLFSPYVGLADDDSEVERFRVMNMDEDEIQSSIISELSQTYARLPQAMRLPVQASLAYYLYQSETVLDRLWGSMLLPFDPPQDLPRFFRHIWKQLFGNTDPMSIVSSKDSIDHSIPTHFG